MIQVLADHNIEGQAVLLWRTLARTGWLAIFPIELVLFVDVGLAVNSTDREIWQFVQAREMLLLTDNRNKKRADSLEQTIIDENTPTALPVVTVGNIKRMVDQHYREACAERLLEIILDLQQYRGAGRIFIP